jgi:hypothetical protein
MPINFWDEWDRQNPDGSTTTEFHAWVSEAPARPPRSRTSDASAGAVGEWHGGTPLPGLPQDPPEYRGRQEPSGPRETGGLPAASRGQGGEPTPQFDEPQMPVGTTLNPDEEAEERMHQQNGEPMFVDARSLKITGRDQRGENWEALVFNRSGVQAPSGWPQSIGDQLYAMQDAFADNSHVHTLGRYQAMLDRHYGARR